MGEMEMGFLENMGKGLVDGLQNISQGIQDKFNAEKREYDKKKCYLPFLNRFATQIIFLLIIAKSLFCEAPHPPPFLTVFLRKTPKTTTGWVGL